jgi:hypothetical protein
VLAAGAGGHVDQLAWFVDEDLVPRSPGDHQSLARPQRCFPVPAVQFQPDPDAAGDQVQELVGVRRGGPPSADDSIV